MLEIGCGNLRAGRLFIDYLDAGNYYGLDISPEILLAGQRTLVEFGLQAKHPRLFPVSDLTFGFLRAPACSANVCICLNRAREGGGFRRGSYGSGGLGGCAGSRRL